jgi:hypothetical protein
MATVAFTQYLRPNGRAVDVSIERPDEISNLADKIVSRGYRFECEHLTTGHISVTIANPKKDIDEDIEVINNGPEVPIAIDRMIKRFASKIGI